MSNHTEKLTELFRMVSREPSCAAFVVGWFATEMDDAQLDDLLGACKTIEQSFGFGAKGLLVERFDHPSRLD